jgi:hypothetical protein
VFEHGNGWGEGAGVVGGFLIDPIATVGTVAVKEIDVVIRQLDPLAVGAEGRDIIEDFP